MEPKADILILEKDCPHCAPIRARLKMDVASDDDFRGKDGQKMFVYVSMSNNASIDLLSKFDLQGHKVPVLVTKDGIRTEPNHILGYLRLHGLSS